MELGQKWCQTKPYHTLLQENVVRNLNYLKSVQEGLKELHTTIITAVLEPKDPRACKFDKYIK